MRHTDLVVLFVSLAAILSLSWAYIREGASWPPPPPYTEKARMARYLAHYADWGIVSAVSPDFAYVPFGTLQSFCDGPFNQSTGTPYFYMASISDTYKNVKYNNSVSFAMTQAESEYCDNQGWDPEEPLCSRLTLVGKMVLVTDKQEMDFAQSALYSRHPAMKNWPTGHDWRVFKLDLTAVCLLDFYGGATHLKVKDYYAAKP